MKAKNIINDKSQCKCFAQIACEKGALIYCICYLCKKQGNCWEEENYGSGKIKEKCFEKENYKR